MEALANSNKIYRQLAMLPDSPQLNYHREEIGFKSYKEQQSEGKIASEDQLRSFNNIIANLTTCNTQVVQFRSFVQEVLPLLNKKIITMKSLSWVGLNVKSKTRYFASAMKQLEDQLKIYGYKLPEMEQAEVFVQSVCSSRDRQTLFFQKVEHFFEPQAPYLKDKSKRVETSKEDKEYDNILTLQQTSEIFGKSSCYIAYFMYNMYVLSQIFNKIMWLFIYRHQKILLQIFIKFKDTADESRMLETYIKAIHAIHPKRTIHAEVKQQSNKLGTQKQIIRPPPQGKSDSNQPKKQPQLTFKQKALSYLQNFFLPRPTPKPSILAKEQQQQQQLRHPKQQ